MLELGKGESAFFNGMALSRSATLQGMPSTNSSWATQAALSGGRKRKENSKLDGQRDEGGEGRDRNTLYEIFLKILFKKELKQVHS